MNPLLVDRDHYIGNSPLEDLTVPALWEVRSTLIRALRQATDMRVMKQPRHFLPIVEELHFEDYHGFQKANLNAIIDMTYSFSDTFWSQRGYVQAEVVKVTSDLSDEIHIHENAFAACKVLGRNEGFVWPKDAYVFYNDNWREIDFGRNRHSLFTIDIPSGTPHGFTVAPGGILYFLSVQSPAIVSDDGHDDYRQVIAPPPPYKVQK